jgi:hypothetical protein
MEDNNKILIVCAWLGFNTAVNVKTTQTYDRWLLSEYDELWKCYYKS